MLFVSVAVMFLRLLTFVIILITIRFLSSLGERKDISESWNSITLLINFSSRLVKNPKLYFLTQWVYHYITLISVVPTLDYYLPRGLLWKNARQLKNKKSPLFYVSSLSVRNNNRQTARFLSRLYLIAEFLSLYSIMLLYDYNNGESDESTPRFLCNLTLDIADNNRTTIKKQWN